MRRRRRRRGTYNIRLPRLRAGQERTRSTSRFAIVQREHNSDNAQVADSWDKIASFIRKVIKIKEEKEREMKRKD